MDIFEWVFKARPEGKVLKEKHTPAVKDLGWKLRKEMKQFNKLWDAHKKKRDYLNEVKKGNLLLNPKSRKAVAKKIQKLNDEILKCFRNVLYNDEMLEALIRKILYETMQRLHEIESTVKAYGSEHSPSWDPIKGEVISPKPGNNMPYYIEEKKRIVLKKLLMESGEREKFIQRIAVDLNKKGGEFEKLKERYATLEQELDKQNNEFKEGKTEEGTIVFEHFIRDEDQILVDIRDLLTNILNKIINFEKEASKLEEDKRDIIELPELPLPESKTEKRVGVMLIHGITCTPQDLLELESVLKGKGYIVYNVRFPGHGYGLTKEEFLTTHVDEMEAFLILAFKHFYGYLCGVNKGDGRFYVAGISLGAMLPLHIMAIRSVGGFPFQFMIKGMVPMGATIISNIGGVVGHVASKTRLETPIMRLTSSVSLYKDSEDKIATRIKKALEVYSWEIKDKKEFERVALEGIKYILRTEIAKLKKKLPLSERRGYTQRELEEAAQKIFVNINKGIRPLAKGAVINKRALIDRIDFEITPFKATYEITKLISRLKKELPLIQVPILILQGRWDSVSYYKSAKIIFNSVSNKTPKKEMHILKHSGHILTIDFDKEKVFKIIINFIKKVESHPQWGLKPVQIP